MNTTAQNPLEALDPGDVISAWTTRGLHEMTDADLLRSACGQLSMRWAGEATSFALHAPLELMARAQLLRLVSPPRREAARQRIAHITTTWASAQSAAGTGETPALSTPTEQPLDTLIGALRDGEPETVDGAFVTLCARRDQDQIVGDLVDIVLPHLGGAAHGAIFLELLPRFRPSGSNPALMARTLLGELAHHPDWQMRWFDQPRPDRSNASLTDRLVQPKADGEPASHFVQPTISLVDETGLAHRTLADITPHLSVEDARRELLPVAAMSMLQDNPDSAPYGWTHCLTLPQAALAIGGRASDAQRAVDAAATYVLGYRATQSTGPIDPNWEPDRPRHFADEITELDSATAAATAWHATPEQRSIITQRLIDYAAPHHDAHLAKYTLACIDASMHDPDNEHVFLAAAAHLAAWWNHHDQTDGALT